MADNRVIFSQMCALAAELEGAPALPARVVGRLSNAFDRAICKALAINFSYAMPDTDYVQLTLFRHAERGVRDYVP